MGFFDACILAADGLQAALASYTAACKAIVGNNVSIAVFVAVLIP